MPTCSKCHVDKSPGDFYRQKNSKNGYHQHCKTCRSHYQKERRKNNKEFISERDLYFRIKYKDRSKVTKKAWESRPEIKTHRNEQQRIRRKNNPSKRGPITPHTKLRQLLSTRILQALKNNSKTNKTIVLLGCSIEEFRRYIESLWQVGMNWKNHGIYRSGGENKWHIDHIRPCASFDLTDPEQQKICFHWSNCQPLWAMDNIRKGSIWSSGKS